MTETSTWQQPVIVVGAAVKGVAGGKEMNETKAIFSFCFSEDEFVKKFHIDL